MSVSLYDLLAPQVMLDVVSRIRTPTARMSRWFGFLPDRIGDDGVLTGPSVSRVPTRSGAYNIFDSTRTIAGFRAPGTGPGAYPANPVGQVPYTCARIHEKVPLLGEGLAQLAKLVGPNSVIDSDGQDYLTRQQKTLAQRVQNAVEVMTWGMFRGHLYLKNTGDDWIPVLTAPSAGTPNVDINFRIPAGNLTKLDMLGGGDILAVSWDNAAAPILSDLMEIDAALTQLTGDTLTDVWINGIMWKHVISNTQVINAGGSANTPFSSFQRVPERGVDGEELSEYSAILRGLPTVTFHICNQVLAIDGTDPSYTGGSGTMTKAIPDSRALFTTRPSKDWVDFLVCPELVCEQDGQPFTQRYGYHFWSQFKSQPAVIELITLLNGIPRLTRPKNLAYGNIVY